MRRIAILAAMVIPVILIMAFSATAFGQTVSPHTGYGATTDFCISCHDIHEAAGDYVLTREATVTAVCGTCHGVFGAPAPAGPAWGSPPADFTGTNPTASTMTAYEVDMSAMSGAQMDAVPGHSLGVMYGGNVVNSSDVIPGGSATLKVMTSGQYGEWNAGLYGGESVTTYNGTNGLYCASCHTPHGGQQVVGPDLLSSRPNHFGVAGDGLEATDELSFCISCHDKRDNIGVEQNHPATYCLTCHYNQAGESDFPHTSTNQKLLQFEADELCVMCHPTTGLP